MVEAVKSEIKDTSGIVSSTYKIPSTVIFLQQVWRYDSVLDFILTELIIKDFYDRLI